MVDSAELFEAIAHPVRIKILKILEKQPSSFASLKRQLDFASSGNLDFHLKKLGELVAVRDDGLYALTKAGKEALLSIDAVETWTEMERHKIKLFPKMPKEALFLGLLEICTTISLFLFFLTLVLLPSSSANAWGFFFSWALLLLGLCSGIGIFVCWRWSWIMALSKSALIMSMSLFLLIFLWNPKAVTPSSSVDFWYLAFVAAEIAAVVVALRHPLKDFLGIGKIKLSYLRAFGGLLCISSGLLLILLESAVRFVIRPTAIETLLLSAQVNTVFASISDTSILCGLLITVGGVLIMSGSSTLGAAISIIFGFFPPALEQLGETTFHAYDLIVNLGPQIPYLLIALLVGSSPIIGGLLALASERRFRT